jgi:hypothetical protein
MIYICKKCGKESPMTIGDPLEMLCHDCQMKEKNVVCRGTQCQCDDILHCSDCGIDFPAATYKGDFLVGRCPQCHGRPVLRTVLTEETSCGVLTTRIRWRYWNLGDGCGVTIVAKINEFSSRQEKETVHRGWKGDWAVYIGSLPNNAFEEDVVLKTIREGIKLGEKEARAFFLDVPEELEYRL